MPNDDLAPIVEPLADLFMAGYKALRAVGFSEDRAGELLPLFVSIVLDGDEDDDGDGEPVLNVV